MNKEKIATTNEGITVNKEKTEMYFKFVCEPFLFFFASVIKSIKISEYEGKKN